MSMKNLLFSISVFFLLVSTTASAQSDSSQLKASITICEKDPQKVIVIVSNPTSEKITIDVYSVEHGYLLNKTTQVNDYRANLDFSTATDGDYTIEVSCRKGEKIRKIVRMETRETVIRAALLK